MSSPQNSSGRYKQKARRAKQLAEWRLKHPAKAESASPTGVAAAKKPAAAAAKPAAR